MLFLDAQVHANGVYVDIASRRFQNAMQQSALFMLAHGNIDIVVTGDGKFRQQSIAVVAVRVNGVAPVGIIAPYRIRQELVLAGGGLAGQGLGMTMVRAQYLDRKSTRLNSSH